MTNLRVLRDLITIFLVVSLLVGLLAVFVHYEFETDENGRWTVRPRNPKPREVEIATEEDVDPDPDDADEPADPWGVWDSSDKKLRIATFDLTRLEPSDFDSPVRKARIVEQLLQFHVIAVQGVQANEAASLLEDVTRRLNESGYAYEFAIFDESPEEATSEETVNAFLFDADFVQLDRESLKRMKILDEASAGLFGSFRVTGPEEEAFSFTLADVYFPRGTTTPPNASDPLGRVFRIAESVDRDEDDVIVLGRFSGPLEEERLESLGAESLLKYSVTTIDGTACCDNILWKTGEVDEYADTCGVAPLLDVYPDMSFEEAFGLCSGMPVFAEFDVREAGTVSAENEGPL